MSTLSTILVQVSQWSVSILIDASLKAAVVLLIAVIAARLLRGASAAVRHRVWALGLGGALLMPILSLTVPQVRLPILPCQTPKDELSSLPLAAPKIAGARLADDAPGIDLGASDLKAPEALSDPLRSGLDPISFDQARVAKFEDPLSVGNQSAAAEESERSSSRKSATSVDFRVYVLAVWSGGLLLVLVPLAFGFAVNWLLLRNSQRLDNGRWFQLVRDLSAQIGLKRRVVAFESPQPVVPMTWGVVCPTVLLPASWRNWSEQRRRCVLLHELAHIKRCDVGFQIMGRLAAGCYWFNPLTWYALRQLRIERELACDDCVLDSGERPSEYAQELVQIARLYRPRHLALGVAIASSARLDQRVLRILDGARSRLPVSSTLASLLFAAAALLVFALAATGVGERSIAAVSEGITENQTQPAQDVNEAAKVPDQPSASDAKTMVRGVVLGPDGKPVAGARVYAVEVKIRSYLEVTQVLAKVATDPDGTFTCQFDEANRVDVSGFNQRTRRQHRVQLVVTAEDYAVGFATSEEWRRQPDAVRIQLAARESLTGRLVDLEGRPLPDVRIEVASIAQSDQPLGEWFKLAATNPRPDEQALMRMPAAQTGDRPQPVRFPATSGAALDRTGIIPAVKTDVNGRFVIPGVGPNRLVMLQAAAPAIARTSFKMVTHPGPAVFDADPDPRARDGMIRGADATVAIEPAVTIRGIVTEADTGQPIDGCRVEVTQVAGSLMGLEDYAGTSTDASGNYVIGQLPADPPNSRGYRLRFTPPGGAPFFPTEFTVRVTGNARTFDVRLPRARLITGRVVDEKTGEPVRSLVGYLPMLDNKGATEFPNFVDGMRTMAYRDFRWNESDGTFRVPAINGRGVLCVAAEHMAVYAIAGRADQIDGLELEEPKPDGFQKLGIYHLHGPAMVNEFREIQLAAVDIDPSINVILRPLRRRMVRIVDANGQPVAGCQVTGLAPNVPFAWRLPLSSERPLTSAETEVVGLEVESPRAVAIHHPQRKLGAVSVIRHNGELQNAPLVVALQPCGQISGRLLDESGQPLQGRRIQAMGFLDLDFPQPKYYFRPVSLAVFAEAAQTRADGRFDITGCVIPGIRYRITVQDDGSTRERSVGQQAVFDPPTKDTPLIEPGKTVDIGDLKPRSKRAAAAAAPEEETARTNTANIEQQVVVPKTGARINVQGRVVSHDGNPIASAKIYIIPGYPALGSNPKELPRVVTSSNDSGAFEFPFDGEPGDSQSGYRILVSAKGYGAEWLSMSEVNERRSADFVLPKDTPVEGRILTLEGQPVVGARITVRSIRAMNDGNLAPYIAAVKAGNGGNFQFDKYVFTAPHVSASTTDADGRFQISGVGQSRVAELEVVGRSIQNVNLRVMTLDSEPIQARAGRRFAELDVEMGRPPVFGASFEWLARPSRPIVGTIVDAKTGQPLQGVAIGTLDEAHATTDENGRFELIGCAKGKTYRLIASSGEQPYLVASKSVADTPGLEPLDVRLEMTRGIVVNGRVTDPASSRPLAARIVYYPLYPNDHVLRGVGSSEARAFGAFCERQTNQNGEYSIPVLPGPGFIGVSATDRGSYQPADVDPVAFFQKEKTLYAPNTRGMASSLILANGGGGFSAMPQSNFHAIELLNLPTDSGDVVHREIQLRAATKVTGVVLDPSGNPLSGASAYGLADDRHGAAKVINGSEFVVMALGDSEKRRLLFRHEAGRLAGTADVTADTKSPLRVTLQPWCEVSGRLTDKDGQPLANLEIGSIGEVKDGETMGHLPRLRATDDQGRFQIDGLVPGLVYAIRPIERHEPQIRIVLKPGEKLDVGDISGTYESPTAKSK